MMNPVEAYLEQVRAIHLSGAGVPETSYYPALSNLLNEIGKSLNPKVRCIITLANKGAGLPDGGLFTADQLRRTPEESAFTAQVPARGAIEVKPPDKSVAEVAKTTQLARYLDRYRQVLVTNLRDFALYGREADGTTVELERGSLAADERLFWEAVQHPRSLAQREGPRLVECLKRVMLHAAPLAAPQDLAAFLASYARDARIRLESHDLPALANLREALEDALGMRFEGEKGQHFFRSTLVQTLFYGVFSAWVIWAQRQPRGDGTAVFDWRSAAWSIELPVLRTLFSLISSRSTLQPLDLVPLVDSACRALNRVDRVQFFAKFEEGLAVQYFYEPFLEAFDPNLRKDLGVWYTPREIVQYQVARVDTVLREELAIEDGLADRNVVVLDPCCGTGTYLVEVLKRIAVTLKAKGGDALLANDLKRAAQERIFGFEILPAPFVVAHLQLGLLLAHLGAPLGGDHERVGVYLTNALTDWTPRGKSPHLGFPDLEDERRAAGAVKREQPVLVILGNPPYNGFAGVGMEEERELSSSYRTTKKAPKPQGQGLNDLYVRFYRMAERKIVEGTGRGIVCFISNYSWLDGLSFTGMREHYLEAFDRIWIDCLNGDKYKTGKLTPEGQPDPSVFSTEWNREGIQVGTAIALLARKQAERDGAVLRFRHLWGKTKRQQLLDSANQDDVARYERLLPALELGLPFMPAATASEYLSWPLLSDLFPFHLPGVASYRDDLVVDVARESLMNRMQRYFDSNVSDEQMAAICPRAMHSTKRFPAVQTRRTLMARGFLPDFVALHAYRPFDCRWIYWEPETRLVGEKVPALFPHVAAENTFLVSTPRTRKGTIEPALLVHTLFDLNLMDSGASAFPLRLIPKLGKAALHGLASDGEVNLSKRARAFLVSMGAAAENLLLHCLTLTHSRRYRVENAEAIRHDWPRIPLPATKELLEESAALGRRLADLLDPETAVKGVTAGTIRPELRAIGPIESASGEALDPARCDLAVTAGWGHIGKGGITMPGKGRLVERPYTAEERGAITKGTGALGLSAKQVFALLGDTTFDVFLNSRAYWRCVPNRAWEYTIGGYQVLKKWLSYRERDILSRDLKDDEARYFTEVARRIGAILLLSPALDENYRVIKENAFDWTSLKIAQK